MKLEHSALKDAFCRVFEFYGNGAKYAEITQTDVIYYDENREQINSYPLIEQIMAANSFTLSFTERMALKAAKAIGKYDEVVQTVDANIRAAISHYIEQQGKPLILRPDGEIYNTVEKKFINLNFLFEQQD